ncbi:hypothetical protein Aph01nite_56340 [Acrocarpospora phusangensis]|uniref:Uncharacterized protein n=1 Tax=Acrocarpospora phusangensis TaxID=1070424 RepID=A0A919QGA5_9ACTN|nr:hypothetical protein [Acrocarpospora phusangensis]GIH27324.1 hypothetical protein Aph01nite_56340 [Acrocarpospora phusangensis]
MSEMNSLDAAEADLVEQSRTLRPDEGPWPLEISLEADPADAAEQGREVGLDDEDDYR